MTSGAPCSEILLRGSFELVLFIKFRLISIPANQDIWHPVRRSAHDLRDGINRYILPAFDDNFIVYMSANETVREVLKGEAE